MLRMVRALLPMLMLATGLDVIAETVLNPGDGPSSTNSQSAVGINLERPNSWTGNYLFVNAALKARKWIAHSCDGKIWDTGATIVTDAEGWVSSTPQGVCPGIFLLDELIGATRHYVPTGRYVLIWEGVGELRVKMPKRANVACKSASCKLVGPRTVRSLSPGRHRATFDVTDPAKTATSIQLMKFSPKARIKNIRVIMPGGNIVTDGVLDEKSYCKSARGPRGPEPTGAVTALGPNQVCRDFELSYWDPVRDSLHTIHATKVPGRRNRRANILFHPLTLKSFEHVRILRATDWTHTTASTIERWSQRTHYRHQNQVESEHGLALEYLLGLANTLGSDLWLSVPHMADDDYVTQLAQFVRDNLHPRLRVYVEYSSEIWNDAPAFTQGRWVEQKCAGEFSDTDAYTSRLKCQAKTAARVAERFDAVFGSESDRVVNVIAGQAASPFVGQTLLEAEGVDTRFDAYAIAPYFGYGARDALPPLDQASVDQVFNFVTPNAVELSRSWVADNLRLASAHGLRLIAYESGQHLEDSNAGVYTPLFVSANRDPRIAPIINDYLLAIKGAGLNEIVYFNDVSAYGADGSWGALEALGDMYTPLAPKWNSWRTFADDNPCWWVGCTR